MEFESGRKGISLNSLVNNVFRKYAEFDRLAEKTEMVTLNKSMLEMLLDLIPEKELYEKVHEYGKQTCHDNLLFWKKEISVDALKEYLTTILCEFCNLGEYDIVPEKDTFVVTHDLGAHGTLFLKAYITGIIEGCMGKTSPMEAVGSTLKFSLIPLGARSG